MLSIMDYINYIWFPCWQGWREFFSNWLVGSIIAFQHLDSWYKYQWHPRKYPRPHTSIETSHRPSPQKYPPYSCWFTNWVPHNTQQQQHNYPYHPGRSSKKPCGPDMFLFRHPCMHACMTEFHRFIPGFVRKCSRPFMFLFRHPCMHVCWVPIYTRICSEVFPPIYSSPT
jgi:hypothetical protein